MESQRSAGYVAGMDQESRAAIKLAGCPRCGGPVFDYGLQPVDGPLCIICGWRRRQIPAEVQAEVDTHLGKSFVETRYARTFSRDGTRSAET